ncbi:MAG: 5-dehydro-4-deoxy-D-glucuronate isomerase [Acidobacteriaceae bacterium]
MRILQMPDAIRYRGMTTAQLRESFLLDDLFQPGTIQNVYVDLDRTVIGSAVPLHQPLALPTYPELRADCFTERRELGVLNIGAPGKVRVDSETFALENLDCLYIGRGNHEIVFSSEDATHPAEFYLLSYPAHAEYPTRLSRRADLEPVSLGTTATANVRQIRKHIHLEGVRSCQLVLGFTEMQPGSVWNTMPPHTHMRRSEIYLYFNLPPEDRVIHMMGPADETRHLVVANKQVAISPGWSMHAGVGTNSYTFCWGMGGENQVYSDMDAIQIKDIR